MRFWWDKEGTLCLVTDNNDLKGENALHAFCDIQVASLLVKEPIKMISSTEVDGNQGYPLPLPDNLLGIVLKAYAEKHPDQIDMENLRKYMCYSDYRHPSFRDVTYAMWVCMEQGLKQRCDYTLFVPDSVHIGFNTDEEPYSPILHCPHAHKDYGWTQAVVAMESTYEDWKVEQQKKIERFTPCSMPAVMGQQQNSYQAGEQVFVNIKSDCHQYKIACPGQIVGPDKGVVNNEGEHLYLVELDLSQLTIPVKTIVPVHPDCIYKTV